MILKIPKYPRKIKIAEKQKPKYYEINFNTLNICAQMPKHFFNEGVSVPSLTDLKLKYTVGCFKNNKLVSYYGRRIDGGFSELVILTKSTDWDKRFLVNSSSLEKIVGNPKTAGTPRYVRINFQDLYSGNMHEFTRAKMINTLKDYMRPYVKELPVVEKFPVRLTLEIVDTVKNALDRSKNTYGQPFDIDNRSVVYSKCLIDLLVAEGKIPSDDRLFITQAGGGLFTPLADDNDENRELILHIEYDDRDVIKNNKYYQDYDYGQHISRIAESITGEQPW